jgi:hypothetical protein
VPPLRLVARFASTARELDAAAALPGDHATTLQRQVASAAVLTLGDVLARTIDNVSGENVGLRGGRFRIRRGRGDTHVALERVRFVDDVEVSGNIDRSGGAEGSVRASLLLNTADGTSGRLAVHWVEGQAHPVARVAGSLGGTVVRAQVPAP